MKLKGLKIYSARGKWFAYIRANGVALARSFEGTREEFLAHLATPKMLRTYTRLIDQEPSYGKGTLGGLIERYKKHPRWTRLKPRTQADYEKVFNFLKPALDAALVEITPADIAETRDRAYAVYPKFSNDVLAALSSVFKVGVEAGWMPANPVTGIERYYKVKSGADAANRRWTDEEWEATLSVAPKHLKAVLGIARWAGLRGQDIFDLRWDAIKSVPKIGLAICITAKKNGVYGEIPVVPQLAALLDMDDRKTLTVSFNSLGRPYPSDNAMRKAWQDFKASETFRKAVPSGTDLTLHGLRVTLASELKEKGFSDEEIAGALLDKTVSMGRHYSRGADQAALWIRIRDKVAENG